MEKKTKKQHTLIIIICWMEICERMLSCYKECFYLHFWWVDTKFAWFLSTTKTKKASTCTCMKTTRQMVFTMNSHAKDISQRPNTAFVLCTCTKVSFNPMFMRWWWFFCEYGCALHNNSTKNIKFNFYFIAKANSIFFFVLYPLDLTMRPSNYYYYCCAGKNKKKHEQLRVCMS